MRRRGLVSFVCLVPLIGMPAATQAQQGAPAWPDPPPPRAQSQPAPVWPDPPGTTRPPAPAQQPAPRRARPAQPPVPEELRQDADAPKPVAPARKGAAASAGNIRCDGPFSKDTSHAALEKAFGAKNVVFQEVDGPEGSKLNASVVFPNDPKRRLEVLWHDEQARRRPMSIVITGNSAWKARGFRIGEPLPAIEKVNGKPFRLAGFEWELGGAARDWQGGALEKLSGGCVLGMRFQPDPSALQNALSKVAGNRDFLSDSPDMRAVAPKVSELIVGYPP